MEVKELFQELDLKPVWEELGKWVIEKDIKGPE